MPSPQFIPSVYTGSKQFTQQDVVTANASGFGAAADDYAERGIDLNEQLVMNKPATFFFRMNSDAMKGSGIEAGDILVVDRSIPLSNQKIIVATVDGDILVRRWEQINNDSGTLLADNEKYGNIAIESLSHQQCWGVVTCYIRLLDASLIAFNKK
jgi:DNA polymerase V